MARFDERGIPVLDLSETSERAVLKTRKAAVDGEPELLTGEQAYLENSRPARAPGYVGPPPAPDVTRYSVGASTLDEALQEIVASYDTSHSGVAGDPAEYDPPEWVASSHAELAKYLAEHYTTERHTCSVREFSEVGT